MGWFIVNMSPCKLSMDTYQYKKRLCSMTINLLPLTQIPEAKSGVFVVF